jgi:type IV pilus assembly protein PilQ
MMHPRRTGYAAFALCWLAVACASTHSGTTAREATEPATVAAAPAPRPAATIESAAFTQDSDGARVVLNADSPLLYTSYEPAPDTLVIEVSGARPAEAFVTPSVEGGLITSLKVDPIEELGRKQTRLTIQHRPGSKFEIASQGKSLAIGFDAETIADAAAKAPVSETPKPPVVNAVDLSATPSDSAPANVPRGEAARSLERVDVTGSGSSAIVSLLGDGALTVTDFALENPPRIVLDVTGVKAEVHQRIVAGAGPVLRARISQYRTTPDRVARVVIDLDRTRPYRTEKDGERLLIRLGESAPIAAAPLPVAPPPGTAEMKMAEVSVAPPPSAPPASPAPEPPKVAATVPESPKPPSAEPPKATVRTAAAVTPPAEKTAPKADAPVGSLAQLAMGPAVDSIPPSKRAHGVLEAKKLPREKPAPARAAAPATVPVAKSAPEDPLFESAEVMLNAQEHPTDRQELANTYKSRTVGGGETQYTGEPISLDLKDADIKDVFRTISELTGLNIVIDPDVHGQATVKLDNVPWDQALELILKQNNLGYIIENNVMRIATTGKLQSEETQRAALDLARQSSLPTRTVIKRLSYAQAGTAATTLKRVMSPRGDVIVDDRTNTLIIREIQDYMPTVLQLLENLDRATDQVVIESRIVETTKTFGHTLGVNWGFSGIADAAHGNTTNLVFPNNGSVAGTVFTRPNGALQPSTTGLALRLGNILDTFNLDIALNAAENQGLVKIISSPRVAAMTNQRASIQTGLQIPVQTTVNNTTSVVYVDATLQLQVTPQITAEGTILMDVNIQKREPAPGVQIQGGGNVPLSIRQAQTKIIVKDGGTAVIGGIFQMNDNDSYNYVPGLGKIPILGNLFRTKQKLENHDELLIFITPRIIH